MVVSNPTFYGKRVARMNGKLFQKVVVCLAVLGTCTPQLALAATAPGNQPMPTNVQLREGGVLVGQVVTAEHIAVANVPVSLRNQAGELAKGKTDKNGHFSFGRLQRGVYRVAAANGHRDFRVWPQASAPPASRPGVLVVAGNDQVRGQNRGGIMGFLGSPFGSAALWAGVATAISVPIAYNAGRQDASP